MLVQDGLSFDDPNHIFPRSGESSRSGSNSATDRPSGFGIMHKKRSHSGIAKHRDEKPDLQESNGEDDGKPKKQKFTRSRTACLQVRIINLIILTDSADQGNQNVVLNLQNHVQIVSKRISHVNGPSRMGDHREHVCNEPNRFLAVGPRMSPVNMMGRVWMMLGWVPSSIMTMDGWTACLLEICRLPLVGVLSLHEYCL